MAMTDSEPLPLKALVLETDPLMWPEAEDPPRPSRWSPPPPFDGSFFDFITGFTGHHEWRPENFVAAYREITAVESVAPLVEVPIERQIEKRILMPLRNAKVGFVLENYFAVIALCGLVAEMVAILLFEMAHHDMPPEEQRQIFGQSFQRLGQERRIDVLKAKGLIDPQQVDWFGIIKRVRNNHLHFLDAQLPTRQDCLDVYRAAYGLVATTFKRDGTSLFGYRRDLVEHLSRRSAGQESLKVPYPSPPHE
jgi:hypothetical protein